MEAKACLLDVRLRASSPGTACSKQRGCGSSKASWSPPCCVRALPLTEARGDVTTSLVLNLGNQVFLGPASVEEGQRVRGKRERRPWCCPLQPSRQSAYLASCFPTGLRVCQLHCGYQGREEDSLLPSIMIRKPWRSLEEPLKRLMLISSLAWVPPHLPKVGDAQGRGLFLSRTAWLGLEPKQRTGH